MPATWRVLKQFQNPAGMKPLFAASALCVLLVLICILFIDRPVERFINAHRTGRILFQAMATPSLLPLPVTCIYLVVCALRRQAGSGLWLRVNIATLAAVAAKDELKFIFGRSWPDTWIKYGIYTFHPFSNGLLYGGFPSGHTSYIAAPLCVLWAVKPQFRIIWGGMILMVMTGLVCAGYHFVGDVIAGFFVGLAAAAGTLTCLPEMATR